MIGGNRSILAEIDRFLIKEAKLRSVIIPVHLRENYFKTVESLISADLFHEIIIVTNKKTSIQIHHNSMIRYLYVNEENTGFCKSLYLNEGLKEVQSDYVLTCDADIIWTPQGIHSMLAPVDKYNVDFAYLNHVTESKPNNYANADFVALHADVEHRYGKPFVRVKIREQNASRPGYGIIYGKRKNFLDLGGYKRLEKGTWGWEDVDFILRLKLISFTLMSAGHAMHLSHSDQYRWLNDFDKGKSRDKNARQSLYEIACGQFYGDLGNRSKKSNLRPYIKIENGIDQLFNI